MSGACDTTWPRQLPATRPVRKVLLYSHDTYGLGHIRRNLAIAQHLLAGNRNLEVVLLSGSVVSDRFELPRGLSIVRLPPVVKTGPDSYRPLDPRLRLGLVRRIRSAVIADVARRMSPDVLLVDHSPAGMGGELVEVLRLLGGGRTRTRVALGLRDVLDEPETVVRSWSRDGIYELLEEAYDELYVYGQRDLLDVGAAYRMQPEVRARLRYTGYLDRQQLGQGEAGDRAQSFLLATVGGGQDGAEVLTAALEVSDRLGLSTLLVTGPLIDGRQRAALDARVAATPGARMMTFHRGLGGLMRAASVVVTMGGYNSMCEAVSAGTPTVVVPRIWPRCEQAIRAGLFAERGLVDVVLPGADLADRLMPVVGRLLAGHSRPRQQVDLGGLRVLAASLLTPQPLRRPISAPAALAQEDLAA